MSEYRRFFSYMYAYEEGAKTVNVGFAKIEMKGTQTSIELHMHDCKMQTPTASFCLFVRNEDVLLGFPLGEVPFAGGATDRRFVLAQTTLGESSYRISDVAGIFLLSQGQICFVSQWDEAPIDWSRFALYAPSVDQRDTADTDKDVNKDETGQVEQANRMEQAKQTAQADSPNGAEMSDWSKNVDSEHAQPQISGENVIQSAELPLTQPQVRLGSWEQNWNALLLTHPIIQPFADTQIQCMRTELKDLRLLPPSNWHLCNNSFLLHSFFMYRHLIFGRFPSAKGMKWFVGVPGIRYRQEHVLAAIFGFSDFLPEKTSADADAPFGYWYTTMNEAD